MHRLEGLKHRGHLCFSGLKYGHHRGQYAPGSAEGLKKAVAPATRSHVPIRQSQSAASAERHTIRSGPLAFIVHFDKGNDGKHYRNSNLVVNGNRP